jgi:hypothetical protein
MGEFNAAHALDEVKERGEQLAAGEKLVPILAAVIAVFAALATLFANHSSISGLATKNQAILAMSKASDQYSYYESKRIKADLAQGLVDAGLAQSGAGSKKLHRMIAKERSDAAQILPKAQSLEKQSDDEYENSERYMQSYERFEVAATLFEVSIVLVSVTALMRTKVLLFIAGGLTAIGIIFFAMGGLLH